MVSRAWCFSSAGTFAVLSIMVGVVCTDLAPDSKFLHFNVTLNKTVLNETAMNAARMGISGTLACLTALIQVGTAREKEGVRERHCLEYTAV